MTTRTYIRDNRGRFARNPEKETDMTRTIYVVNWTPEGVGGFEWRRERSDAEWLVKHLDPADPTVRVHAVELPDEVGDDPEGITAWLDSEGWSDGGDPRITERLEYLRGEIRAERISQGEVIELQGLAKHIDPGDVELLEWAGVPEFPDPDKHDFVPGALNPRVCEVCGDDEGANDHLDPDDDGHTWGGMDGFTASDIERLNALADQYGFENVVRWVEQGWDYAGSDNPTPPTEDGTSGQDRESYSDDQDRADYTVDESDDDGPAAWPSWAPTDEPDEPAKTYHGVPGMLDIPAGEVVVGDLYDGYEVVDVESYGPDHDRDVRFVLARGTAVTNTGNIPAGRILRVQRDVESGRYPQVVKVTTPAASFDRGGKHVGPGRWLELVRKVNAIEPDTFGEPVAIGSRLPGFGDASVEEYIDAYVVHVNWRESLESQRTVVVSKTPKGAKLIRQAAEALGLHFEVEG